MVDILLQKCPGRFVSDKHNPRVWPDSTQGTIVNCVGDQTQFDEMKTKITYIIIVFLSSYYYISPECIGFGWQDCLPHVCSS